MKGMTEYGAVATKIRGMRAHLLTEEEYVKLASSTSVKEIASYLKTHPSYAEALEELDPDNMRRETFERLLPRSLIRDIHKIEHFLNRKQKNFFNFYQIALELRLLNNVVREIFNKYSNPVDLTVYRAAYADSKNFSVDQVLAATSVDSLMEALKDTIYYEPLRIVEQSMETPILFDYETSLNRFYFKTLWEKLEELGSPVDKKAMLEAHGPRIDMLNLLWIYRSKAYYKVDATDIMKYLIPAYHKLKASQVAEMVQTDTVEDLMACISRTYYGRFIDASDPSSIERAYNELRNKKNNRNRQKYPYSMAVIEAYIFNKETEISHLVRISESVRYGYDSKLILDVLNIGGNK